MAGELPREVRVRVANSRLRVPLSHNDYLFSLNVILANASKQVLELMRNENVGQLETVIKALLLVRDAADTALPMLRGWHREARAKVVQGGQ